MEKYNRIRAVFGSRDYRGFTLIELLIVIAIIGILVSISTASYASAQKKSRDSRRMNDMKAAQNAWEQYYADNNYNYPATCSLGTDEATYLPGGMPTDPRTGNTYTSMYGGWSSCSATSYCFCAGLEASANTTTDCAGDVAPTGYAGLTCVRNLQ